MSGETSDDWRMCTDRKTGKTYFYNKRTQVSQWTKPPEWKLDPLNNPAKWKEAIDRQSGLPYWSNAAAGKSTFVKPACLTPQAALSPSDEEVKAAWKEAKDPKTGGVYWINTITNEASWDNPFVPAGSAAPQSPEIIVAPKSVLVKQSTPEKPPSAMNPVTPVGSPPSSLHGTPERGSREARLEEDKARLQEDKARLEEANRLLEKQARAFVQKEKDWEHERAQLLKRQQELEAEVAMLRHNTHSNEALSGGEKANQHSTRESGEAVSLAQLQQEMLAKFTLLDLQNQQVIALLQQNSRPTLRERAH